MDAGQIALAILIFIAVMGVLGWLASFYRYDH